MADGTKRIIDQPLDTALSPGDLIIVDSEEPGAGTRKFDLGTELTDIKEDLQDLQEEIEGGGSGLTAEAKAALIACFNNVAWDDTDGQEYINALYNALYPPVTAISINTNSLSFATLNSTQQLTATTTPVGGNVTWASSDTSVATVSSTGLVTSIGYGSATITATSGSVSATCTVTVAQATLVSISAVYTQSGTVYNTDSLDSLKSDLVVTATWSDSSTSTVASADYTLSGTLEVGTSTITVSYGGKTTTFNVTVTVNTLLYKLPQVTTFDGSNYIDTEVAPFVSDRDFTIAFDFEWASDAPNVTCVFRCGEPRFVLQAKASNAWKFYFQQTASWGSTIPSGTRAKCVAKHSQGGGFDLYIQPQGGTLESSTQSWNLLTTENTLYIGANQGNGSSYNFRGTIYDFKIDSVVWDADEVNAYLAFA